MWIRDGVHAPIGVVGGIHVVRGTRSHLTSKEAVIRLRIRRPRPSLPRWLTARVVLTSAEPAPTGARANSLPPEPGTIFRLMV